MGGSVLLIAEDGLQCLHDGRGNWERETNSVVVLATAMVSWYICILYDAAEETAELWRST